MTDQDFIGVYDQALPAATCAALVARFHASGEDRPGRVGAGVMPELKDSRDIGISGKPAWRDASGESLHRWLLWTIYLNEGFEAGETEFLYQERRIEPRTGRLPRWVWVKAVGAISNRPRGGDKVIATSWILFQRAEALYPPR